jgi:hypothetical protein
VRSASRKAAGGGGEERLAEGVEPVEYLVEYGAEELALAAGEVVVERALPELGPVGDLLDACVGVPALGEHGAGGVEHRAAAGDALAHTAREEMGRRGLHGSRSVGCPKIQRRERGPGRLEHLVVIGRLIGDHLETYVRSRWLTGETGGGEHRASGCGWRGRRRTPSIRSVRRARCAPLPRRAAGGGRKAVRGDPLFVAKALQRRRPDASVHAELGT